MEQEGIEPWTLTFGPWMRNGLDIQTGKRYNPSMNRLAQRLTFLILIAVYANAAFTTVGVLLPGSLRTERAIKGPAGNPHDEGGHSLRLDRQHAASVKASFDVQLHNGITGYNDEVRVVGESVPLRVSPRIYTPTLYSVTDSSPPFCS
jgi:hypothetical protein